MLWTGKGRIFTRKLFLDDQRFGYVSGVIIFDNLWLRWKIGNYWQRRKRRRKKKKDKLFKNDWSKEINKSKWRVIKRNDQMVKCPSTRLLERITDRICECGKALFFVRFPNVLEHYALGLMRFWGKYIVVWLGKEVIQDHTRWLPRETTIYPMLFWFDEVQLTQSDGGCGTSDNCTFDKIKSPDECGSSSPNIFYTSRL